MAKKKRRSYRRKFTIPLAVVGGIAASPAIYNAATNAMQGNWQGSIDWLARLAGYGTHTKTFHFDYLIEAVTPIFAGYAVHKLASMLGINRQIAAAKIPFIRI